MDVRLSLRGETRDQELRSLRRWLLAREGTLRRDGVALLPDPPPDLDEMGGAFEIVQFVLDTTAQFGALAVALAAWRDAHGSRSTMVLERDGVRITLTGADLADEERARRLLATLREDDR